MKNNYFTLLFLCVSLFCYAQPPNDLIAGAEGLTLTTASATSVSFSTIDAMSEMNSNCESDTETFLDIWYQLSMPVNGNIRVTGADNNDGFTLYTNDGTTELSCRFGNGLLYNLTAGDYKLRVANITGANDSFSMQAFTAITNDECTMPEVLTDLLTPTTFTFDSRGATESLNNSCEEDDEVFIDGWYEFTMPVNGNIRISGAGIFDSFTLYDSCGGAEIVCGSRNQLWYNLVSGTTYKIRVANRDIYVGSSTFTIQAFETLTNDECTSPEVLTDLLTPTNFTFDSRAATESLNNSCEDDGEVFIDGWYEFTMPVNGNITISGAGIFDSFTLYGSCGGAEIVCGVSNQVWYNLTSGTTYKMRVANEDIYVSSSTFTIQAFETLANDECTSPEVLTDLLTPTTFTFDSRAATESLNNSCEDDTHVYLDGWYEFTMPVNGNIRITGAGIFDSFTLYDSCGGTEIECGSNSQLWYNLTSGTTYKMRVANRAIYVDTNTFDIQAFETLSNDECGSAEVLSVSEVNLPFTFDSRGATESLNNSCENDTQIYIDGWYEFTMPVDGSVEITSAEIFDSFTLYDSCGGAEIACGFSNQTFSGLMNGQNYKLRIANRAIYVENNNFNIKAVGVADNDECTTATDLNLGVLLSSTNNFATASTQTPECFDFDRQDVWFKVNSGTATSFDVTVSPNGYFQIWEGACGSLTQLAGGCHEFTAQDIPVTTNTDYYIQVWLLDIAESRVTGDFDIIVADGVLSTIEQEITGFKMYPNPVQNSLNFSSEEPIRSIEIYSVLGQKVVTKQTNETQLSLETNQLNSGLYFVKVKTENQIGTYRLIKK